MKNSLNARLLAAFGAIFVFVALVSVVAATFTFRTQGNYQSLTDGTLRAGHLLTANSALWELRYAISQAMSANAEGTAKLAQAEAKHFATIDQALTAYAGQSLSATEREGLQTLREGFARYEKVRPKWFEMRIAGQNDEAKAWRSQHTTPVGSALVAAMTKQIDLQSGAAQAESGRLQQEASWVRAMVMGLCLVALVLCAALAMWIFKVLTGPLALATDIANRITEGELANAIPYDRGPLGNLLDALRNMQQSLAQTVSAVRANAESVAMAGSEIAAGNADLSNRTESQASALQQTASSMDELGSTVDRNAEGAGEANELAQSACTVAIRGGSVVADVVSTMQGINDSSRRIADIVGVIDGIAFQTNILALNAAVEAARAGDQGRGFAVVATEVRSLAQRSASAAREIKGLIATSVERVEQGSALVDRAGATMQEVVAAIQGVSTLVGEISAASKAQSQGVAVVSKVVAQMDHATQQNAALVEQSAAAADNLKTRAQELVQAVAVFRLA
ncbi:methyl-accepting chemotaxis protein [Rhodoferax sp. AJA081-3]|uniref:methyl-accepting chemotaxis protein n=1 Tax=Rhodoferax sp. AJA081-3 TaxID=2752316 RepID=UPI0027397EC9|nr:methyl-accepting chemotaxis protein [Rhodoferax sp. AJA081-3]